jgi:hypothetical protein
MRAVTHYLSWEMLAIHVITGAFFALASALIFVASWQAEPWFALITIPFTAFCAWGWYAEYRYFLEASAAMRRRD